MKNFIMRLLGFYVQPYLRITEEREWCSSGELISRETEEGCSYYWTAWGLLR